VPLGEALPCEASFTRVPWPESLQAQSPSAATPISSYAARLQRLRPGGQTDKVLLRALPKNRLDFWFVYALTTPVRDVPTDLSDLVYEYYAGAAKAVARTGRDYVEYLRLSEMALSGEMLDFLQGHNEALYDASPKRFRAAARLLSAKGRAAACGENIQCSGLSSNVR